MGAVYSLSYDFWGALLELWIQIRGILCTAYSVTKKQIVCTLNSMGKGLKVITVNSAL